MNERISIHPRICHGQACISGTRIPVHQIVRMFAHGDSIDALLGAYSSITREDILACLDYAASLAEEQVAPRDRECSMMSFGLLPRPSSGCSSRRTRASASVATSSIGVSW